ncbi:hypothetical protein FRC01_007116 [Tulasnella sp. 417]|nr:hypothetical protein FRC01_007116 [Tulasnella sp. 417]
MSQRTNTSSSPKAGLQGITIVDKVSPSSTSAPKPRPAEGCVGICSGKCIGRCENGGKDAPDRLGAPLKTPQGWEPELSDFDFDFTASPGAEEWQIGETTDGRAVYSTVGGAAVGVTVEFQKWAW